MQELFFSKKISLKKYGILISVLLLVFVLTSKSAFAQSSITSFVTDVVVGDMLKIVIGWITSLIAFVGYNTNEVLKVPINSGVVTNAWTVVRNFANMLFIIALIIMAFGTIFDIRGYDFRTLIARFIIAALLINFSLVIGTTIIDWTQSISDVFLQSIGDVGARIAQGADLSSRFQQSGQNGIPDAVLWNSTGIAFINMILLSIVLFSLVVLFFFTLIRIPILWALLIISPIAWITYILPSTNNISRRWWKEFIGWNLFLPIYLFFIYFGTYFLNNQQQILQGTGTPLVQNFPIFDVIFFYILIALFLIGGAKMAMSASSAAGAGGVAAGLWARGRATARWAGYLPARGAAFAYRTSGAQGAVEQRLDQFKREGFTGTRFEGTPLGIYGGKEGLERSQAKWAERFGVRGAGEKQLPKDVESAKYRIRTETNLEKLQGMSGEGATYQRLAAIERIAELRPLKSDEILTAYNAYGGDGSVNARKFIEKIDPKNLSKEERDFLYKDINDLRFRQKIADVRAEKGDFAEYTDESGRVHSAEDVFVEQSTIFTSDADKADYLRKSKDYLERLRPDQRRAIFSDSRVNGEMKREMAMILADKGDFGGLKGEDNEVIAGSIEKELTAAAKLFEGKNQQDALLNKAKKKYLIESLKVKKDMGLFGPDADYQKEVTREVSKLDNEEILSLSKGSLQNEELITALIESINEKRIPAITRSNKAEAAKLKVLNTKVFPQIRINTAYTEKVVPLKEYRDRVKVLVTEVTSARTANDSPRLGRLKEESDQIQKKSKKIYEDLLGQSFATNTQKEEANNYMNEIKSLLNALKRTQ